MTQLPTPPPPSGGPGKDTGDTRLIASPGTGGAPPAGMGFGAEKKSKLGPYVLQREIGRGGMGVVFKAWDEALDRPVALKVIAPEYASASGSAERLRLEARAAAQLLHQNIVGVYAFGEDGGHYYIAMEYLEGIDLGEHLRRDGPMPLADALRVVRQSAAALDYAWARQIVHRDIKPSNLFMTKNGEAKVMDFGLAKQLDLDQSLTATGAIIGTPNYMAPEQGQGEHVDHRADMYSLGCTLFTMVSGDKPFTGRTPLEVMMRHANEPMPIPPEWKQKYGQPFIDFILRLSAKNRVDRFATWGEVIAAIDAISTNSPTARTLSGSIQPYSLPMMMGTGAGSQTAAAAPRGKGLLVPALVVGAVLLVGVGVTTVVLSNRSSSRRSVNRSTTTPAATATAVSAPLPTPQPKQFSTPITNGQSTAVLVNPPPPPDETRPGEGFDPSLDQLRRQYFAQMHTAVRTSSRAGQLEQAVTTFPDLIRYTPLNARPDAEIVMNGMQLGRDLQRVMVQTRQATTLPQQIAEAMRMGSEATGPEAGTAAGRALVFLASVNASSEVNRLESMIGGANPPMVIPPVYIQYKEMLEGFHSWTPPGAPRDGTRPAQQPRANTRPLRPRQGANQ